MKAPVRDTQRRIPSRPKSKIGPRSTLMAHKEVRAAKCPRWSVQESWKTVLSMSSCRLALLLGRGAQTSWPVGSVFPNRSCSDWWAPRLPACQKATDWKPSLCRKSTLLSHLYDRGFMRELLREELELGPKEGFFINLVIKEFLYLSSCCLH